MPKHLSAAPLVLLALALIAGCGGEDKPSKAEYVAKLDKVCKDSNERIQKVKSPRTIKEIGRFTRDARPILEDSVKEAEDLELPEEQGDQFKAYVSDSKRSLDELDDLEKAADSGSTPEVRKVFTKITRENRERDQQARKLGLKQCGSG